MSCDRLSGACWGEVAAEGDPKGLVFVRDHGGPADAFAGLRVVVSDNGPDRLPALLEAGAEEVLVGDSALHDANLINTLAGRFENRVGLWLPVQRAAANWGIDRHSNADFTFLAASNPVPRWLVRDAAGGLTDVDAVWWAGQMVARGAARVLVAVFEPEDDDLHVCAEMAEAIGDRFWLSTGSTDPYELRFWVRYGQARNLVLPKGADATRVMAELHAVLEEEAV